MNIIWKYFNPPKAIDHRHSSLIDIIGSKYNDLPVEVWDIIGPYYDVYKWMSSKRKKCRITQVKLHMTNAWNLMSTFGYRKPGLYEDWEPLQLEIEIWSTSEAWIKSRNFHGAVGKPINIENHGLITWNVDLIVDREDMIFFITLIDPSQPWLTGLRMSNIPVRFFEQTLCLIEEELWFIVTPCIDCECRMKIELLSS